MMGEVDIMSSFMSERTAEYILVPSFIHALANSFKSITPFFYWSTREGNKLSRECSTKGKFRLVAMFPRRPKLTTPNSKVISAKINDTIFARVPSYNYHGISVFSGIPCVSSILKYTRDTKALWFLLNDDGKQDAYVDILVPSGEVVSLDPGINGPLSSKEIINNISNRLFTWSDIIDTLQEIKRETKGISYSRWFFDTTYKPVYFVLREK